MECDELFNFQDTASLFLFRNITPYFVVFSLIWSYMPFRTFLINERRVSIYGILRQIKFYSDRF